MNDMRSNDWLPRLSIVGAMFWTRRLTTIKHSITIEAIQKKLFFTIYFLQNKNKYHNRYFDPDHVAECDEN
jgi:hypothetical protein